MKKQILNLVTSSFLAFVMAVTPICAAGTKTAQATATNTAEPNTSQGSNVGAHNYGNWPSTTKSYLSSCEDGHLMRVQGVNSKGTLVEYYEYDESDKSVQSLKLNDKLTKVLDCELPLFGAFYETDKYYFLFTGQNNPGKSPDVEVYRITKYDKEWNKIGEAGLKNWNTTKPFAFGTAHMAASGKYLVIRTCHNMYNGHQANVMIQLDMDTMTVTDSFNGVGGAGYVSHSFQQLVKVDDDHIVSVDHGDYYPRGVLLTKYNNTISSGKFNTSSTRKRVFTIASSGVYTGTSVGGFEISGSSYLVAGNSCMRNGNTNTGKTPRDIFVTAEKKDNIGTTEATNITWLTDYTEAADSAQTPHLVEVDKNNYVVLWQSGNKVCYKSINGEGEPTTPSAISATSSAIDAKLVEESTTATAGTICELEGNLSDVTPIVINNEIVWYTWNQKNITFYGISTKNLFDTRQNVITNDGITYPPSAISSQPPEDDTNGDIDGYSPGNAISGGGTSLDYTSGGSGETSAPSATPSVAPSATPSVAPSAAPSAIPSNTTVPTGSAAPGSTDATATTIPTTTETPAASQEPVSFDISQKPSLKTTVTKGSNSVKFNWDKVDGADGYIISQYNKKNNKYKAIKTISNPEKTTCSIKMSYATSYSFKIRAFKTQEDGSKIYGKYSSIIKVTTAPAKVNNLKVKRAGNSKVSLSWTKVKKASGYQIFSSNKKNGKYSLVKTLKKGSALSTTVKQKGKKTCYYKVRAYVTNADKKRVYGSFGKSLASK